MNQEPTDYESAALTVELRALRSSYLTHLAKSESGRYYGYNPALDARGIMASAHAPQAMKKLRFLLSLTNDDNDYQVEQMAAARQAARRLDVELEVTHAANDGILQSQQILDGIRSTTRHRPDAIIFEPAGSSTHPQVARAAAAAGVGVVVLNRDANYLAGLRRLFHVPVFAITSNHEEIGRIQGRQLRTLLPGGGNVLYIHGPGESSAAKQRYAGTLETKSDQVQLRVLKSQWTESSAHKAVTSWLRLFTSRQMPFQAVCAQDDSMAMGARKAIEEHSQLRTQLSQIPFLGCDGMPKTGQDWLRRNLLAATIFVPPNADCAIEMLVKSIQTGELPPEYTFTTAKPLPPLEVFAPRSAAASR